MSGAGCTGKIIDGSARARFRDAGSGACMTSAFPFSIRYISHH